MIRKSIIRIRERYNWKTASQIVFDNNVLIADRIILALLILFLMPCILLLFIVMVLTYIPHMLYLAVSDKLGVEV